MIKRFFYDKKSGEYVGSTNTAADSYAITVAAYSDRQIQGALIRAKNPKREILLAEKLKRES